MTEQPFREEQDPREDHDGAEPQPAPFPPELDPLDPHFGGEEELEDEDEAIARAQGVSLRTVRRRIADLMAEHGVDTRFQLALKLIERESTDDG